MVPKDSIIFTKIYKDNDNVKYDTSNIINNL